jgi:hypothetical protein
MLVLLRIGWAKAGVARADNAAPLRIVPPRMDRRKRDTTCSGVWGGARVPRTALHHFGNPANSEESRGFASPPHDGFAFVDGVD